MRYAVRRPSRSFDGDKMEDNPYPFMPIVFEDDDYIGTGLIDEHGNEIVRYVGVLPIGFLADHSEE